MPRRYDSAGSKRRILSACVRLFIEKGYHRTTLAEILKEADVTSSTFQNIFHTKDGVLMDLVVFMFRNQFSTARSFTGPDASPAMVYAVETAIQLALAEANENLRDVYVEAYSHAATLEYINRHTSEELHKMFSCYQPALTAEDFYELDIGSAGIMRAYMAYPCTPDFPLEQKVQRFHTMCLRAFAVPEDELTRIRHFFAGLDLRKIADNALQTLFQALAMHFDFSLTLPAETT